jgi:hypothetical protein
MDVYPHMVINDDLDVCYDAFQPMLGPVYDTSIVRAHTSEAAAPSVAHDHEHALAGMFPKQCFGIPSGPTDRYIESRHLCLETCSSTAPCCPCALASASPSPRSRREQLSHSLPCRTRRISLFTTSLIAMPFYINPGLTLSATTWHVVLLRPSCLLLPYRPVLLRHRGLIQFEQCIHIRDKLNVLIHRIELDRVV